MNRLIKQQFTDMSGVRPEYKYREENGKHVAYLNSPAGHLIYKTKHHYEMSKFRDDVLNKMSALIVNNAKEKEYFKLYKMVRDKYKVEFNANIHTRLKSLYVF